MENTMKFKKIWGAFALIFISGILLGGISGFYVGKIQHRREMKPQPQSFRQHEFDRYAKDLNLTPEQQKKIRPVFEKGLDRRQDFWTKHTGELVDIISLNYEETKVFLNPDQLKKMEEKQKKHIARFKEKLQEK